MTAINMQRRRFLQALSIVARGSCIALPLPVILSACREAGQAGDSGFRFRLLNEVEVAEFDAITSRIIPSDGSPGAREAGTVNFLDTVLSDGREQEYEALASGLTDLQAEAALAFGVSYIFELTPAQLDELLRQEENGVFFQSLRYLTLASLFALPQYGGDQSVGYELIGYDDRHAWSPPFGAYDRDEQESA